MDELGLVDWIVGRSAGGPGRVRVGPGDDAAVLGPTGADEIVFTIDEVVEGTHFRLSGKGLGPRASGRDVGYKAMIASVSDLAAMGAEPVAAVAAASLRKGQAGSLGKRIHDGLTAAARECGCPLVGGNVTGTLGPVTLAVSSVGRAPRGKAFLRSGARPGDALFVTGELGGSILGRHLRPVARFPESRLCRKLGGVRAMMDVTDGLALDLWRLARESGVGAVVEASCIPVSAAAKRLSRSTGRTPVEHALSDGEDYELLFTVEARKAEAFERSWRLAARTKAGRGGRRPSTGSGLRKERVAPLARIGSILPEGEGLQLTDDDGTRPLRPEGFRHL